MAHHRAPRITARVHPDPRAPKARCGAAWSPMACSRMPSSSATTPASSTRLSRLCGSTPSGSSTSWSASSTPAAGVCADPGAGVVVRQIDLKAYCRDPTPPESGSFRPALTGCYHHHRPATLLRARLHANKIELLRALERPDIPLHTNGSENDIRCQVTRRKISGGTRSETGRDCATPSSA